MVHISGNAESRDVPRHYQDMQRKHVEKPLYALLYNIDISSNL